MVPDKKVTDKPQISLAADDFITDMTGVLSVRKVFSGGTD